MGSGEIGYWVVPLDSLTGEERTSVLWGIVWRAACFVAGWLTGDSIRGCGHILLRKINTGCDVRRTEHQDRRLQGQADERKGNEEKQVATARIRVRNCPSAA